MALHCEVVVTDVEEMLAFVRAQVDEDERLAREAAENFLYEDGHDRQVYAWLQEWAPSLSGRVLAEVEAKRRRLDWLAAREHDIGEEDFPTYSSCRMLLAPGELGDLEVGYCSCGLDSWREQLLKIETMPYVGREGWRAEWALR